MSVTYGFYNSVSGDRKYNADQMSAIFNYLITDGVLESMGSQYRVDPGTGRQILVQPGWAWFDSTWTLNDSALPLAIPTPDISYARIDAVVIETDKSTDKRMNSIKLVIGTPSANPVKPTLANTALVKQHVIAYVKVRAATTSIASGDIERMVGKSQCPFITGILQTVSVQSLFNQWESEWNTFKSTSQTQFNNAQAQRTADFNTAQTSRDTAFTQAQNQRASDFTAAQTQRANDFNSAQSARNTQWTTWFNQTESDWDNWFEHIQLVLSEDVVANLQLQIDQNTGDIESLQTSVNSLNTSLGQTNTNVTNLQTTVNGLKDRRSAKCVIGTSVSGWTAKDVDYLCDGVADEVEINNAIRSINTDYGAEIIILSGDYNLAAPIFIISKSNIQLTGNGSSTFLRRTYNSTASSGYYGMIYLNSVSNGKITNLYLNGNKATYNSTTNHGIHLANSYDCVISGVYVVACSHDGIFSYNSQRSRIESNEIYLCGSSGIELSRMTNTLVSNNFVINSTYGIWADNTTTYSNISGNALEDCGTYGVYSVSKYFTMASNYIANCGYGMYEAGNGYASISANTFHNNNVGIYCNHTVKSVINGNLCYKGTGNSTDYNSNQYTIYLDNTTKCLVTSNIVIGKAITNISGSNMLDNNLA